MALAVCLLFDSPSDRAIRGLWDRLEQHGVSSLRSHTHGRHVPHLSFAVLRSWDIDSVAGALAAIGSGPQVEVRFDGVGLFRRGRVWLIPGVTVDLLVRQQRVVQAVTATGAELHKHYRPGAWLPHCSLAPRTTLTQLPAAVGPAFDVLPMCARLDRAALVNSATGEIRPLPGLP